MPDTNDTSKSATRATPMKHECNTSDTSAKRERHEQYECDTSAHEYYTNGTSATWVESFNFDNDTSKNIISHPYDTIPMILMVMDYHTL